MCPSGESHVPEGERLGTREQGKRVRRRAGEYPPARLLLPGGLDGLASRDDSRGKLHGRENGGVRGREDFFIHGGLGYADLGDGSGRCGVGPGDRSR